MTRFGIALPTGSTGGSEFGASSLADAARRIEAAGFESAWTFDSVGRGTLRPDPLMALAVAGTVTRTIELGTGVFQVPLRNPVELAQRVLTTHLVSGGGFSSGWARGRRQPISPRSVSISNRASVASANLSTSWAASGRGERGRRVPRPHLARAAGRTARAHRLVGRLEVDRARGPRVRRLDRVGARSSWRALREGIARFRDLGGKRAIVTNVRVDLDSAAASPDGPEDPCDLKGTPEIARERLHRLREWGYDDIVLVPGRHEAAYLQQLRALCLSSR